MRKLFLSLLLVFCFAHVSAQSILTEQSSVIKEKLIDLKKNSAIVTEQLTQLSENLKVSQQEALEWKEQSMRLSDSLTSINEQLNDCYQTIEQQKTKLKLARQIIYSLLIILVIRTVCMIIGFILFIKGVKLPRWLDILL